MKSRDQLLLEQAYEATRSLKFGQDEKGPFVHHKTMEGKVLPNRFWRFHDSEGNVLDKTTPLADGQITYQQNHNTVDYYQVKKQEDGFVGIPFKPSPEVADLINNQTKGRIEKDKNQAMNHFFGADYSKLSDDELLNRYSDCLKYTFEPGQDPVEQAKHQKRQPKIFAELEKRGLGRKGASIFAHAREMAR